MDIIRLNNMVFYAYHGYYSAEQERGQKFEIDLELECDFRAAAASDRLSDAVDYHRVYQHLQGLVVSRRFALLEALVDTIATEVLAHFAVAGVRVRVRKPHVAISGLLDSVEVEHYRRREP